MSVKLEYPYASPTQTITLPSPERGNSEQHQRRLLVKKDMDGNLHSYKQGTTKKKFLYTFPLIRSSLVASVRAWLNTYEGQDIKLTDWNSDVYRVKLLSNPVEISQINSVGDVSMTLEFTE